MPSEVYVRTEEHKRINSECHRGKMPVWLIGGRQFTEEHKRKISEGHRGKKHSEETKRKISIAGKRRRHSEETKKKMSRVKKGIKLSEEHRQKLRAIVQRQIAGQIGGIPGQPFFNPIACEWFAEFDRINNTEGQYATNGGEYYVEIYGYWLDYINFGKKIIIEYDEDYHKLYRYHDRDIIRQQLIQKIFPEFLFMRIKEGMKCLQVA